MKIKLLLMIMALGILMMSGCQQVNDMVNGNKATNTNTVANSNASANTNANSNANSNTTANSNANSNTTANSNANANTSASPTNSATNANTQASNTTATTKEEVPLTKEAEVFKNNLVGEWIGDVNMKFTENTYEFSYSSKQPPYEKGSYKVVNENALELVSSFGKKWSATMRIEGDGNTLIWTQPQGEWEFKRVKPN